MDKILQDSIEFVNAQVAFHTRQFSENETKAPKKAARHKLTIDQNEAVKSLLIEQDAQIQSLKEQLKNKPLFVRPAQLELSLDEIQDLPADLIAELSFSDADRFDYQIQSLIAEGGGSMSLDQVLVAIYRKTGEVHKRTAINNRLYKMSQKENPVLFAVPSKKGAYSTVPQLVESDFPDF